ncbi:MAG: ABC transporter permease [Treponema sp.]|nr:ABC transporter permease [Candidatus Treponema equi]
MMSDFKWILFVSQRFSKVDRKGRTAVTSWLASLGVCFGVMALIVIMAVMNGFQMSFIDSIMEISSCHVRVSGITSEREAEFISFCKESPEIKACVPFYEAHGLLAGSRGLQTASIIRTVPKNVLSMDEGFKKELRIVSGKFDLTDPDSIVIGNTIAYNLKLRKGSKVNIAALSGSSDTALLSSSRVFTVKGIFFCGYADINAGYCFISNESGEANFGRNATRTYGIKLTSSHRDVAFIDSVKKNFPEAKIVSWREFNRSFFGVLRMEKNILFTLVFLIFIVVAVNIYNSMKRLVYERKEEIAVLSALGASPVSVHHIFLAQGAKTGICGAFPGLLLGIVVSKNISSFFDFLGRITGNPMFGAYAAIPGRLVAGEVFMIFMFGLMSALVASWLAGRCVLKMTVSEVLRDE